MSLAQNQARSTIKTLTGQDTVLKAFRTDSGGEFLSHRLRNRLNELGAEHHRKVLYNLYQNGLAEMYNRTLLNSVRAMLSHSGTDKCLWTGALGVRAYVRNRATGKALPDGATPFELWVGTKPDICNMRTFGCRGWYKPLNNKLKMLDDRAEETYFLGYTHGSNVYRLWDKKQEQLIKSRTVHFDRSSLPASCLDVFCPQSDVVVDIQDGQISSMEDEELQTTTPNK